MSRPTESDVTEGPELPSSVAELTTLVRDLQRQVADLASIIAARDARIKELESSLEGSHRAGKRQAAPFSKGAPKPNPAKPGRKSGPEHGRHGHRMAPAHIDRTLDAPLPDACPGCGGHLSEGDPADQFHTELPEPRPIVTRFVVHRGHCTNCGRKVQGRHPEQSSDALGAAASGLGPRAKAWGIWMHYSLGVSFGRVAQAMSALCGITISRAAVYGAAHSASVALTGTHEAIKSELVGQASVTMDETGWRIGGYGAWLWVGAATGVTVYEVAWSRGFGDAVKILPANYTGTLVRDGWSTYRRYESASQQTCIAHLLRRCHEMKMDNPPEHRDVPCLMSQILHEALAARELPMRRRKAVVKELSKQVEALAAMDQPYDPNRRLVAHVAGEHDRGALFSFLTHDGVEATNWRGETGVRPAVVNRKTWGGNRTESGAVVQGRIMTFLRTATQQGVDAIELLVTLAREPMPGVVINLFAGTPGP